MNPFIITAISVLLSVTSFAQNKTSKRPVKYSDDYLNSRMFIKVNPFAAFDPKTPTAMPGLEFRFSKKFAVELSVGLPLKYGDVRTTDTVHHDYYKLKAEIKYFPRGGRIYIGPEAFYVKKDSWVRNGVFRQEGTYYSFTEGTINRTAWGLAFKFGFAAPLSRRLHFDCFMGMGVRFQQVDVQATGMERIKSLWWFDFHENSEGPYTGPHYAFGLKVGYRLF